MLRLLGSLVFLLGIVLGIGGIQLVSVGGSWGYLPLAILLVVSGIFTVLHRRYALALYGAAVLYALGWGLVEVGLDWWALAPRGGLLIILGIALLAASFWKNRKSDESLWSKDFTVLTASVVIGALIGVISMFADPHGIKTPGQSETFAFRGKKFDAPATDWTVYGGTNAGQHYSSLDQITPDNVGKLEKIWEFHAGDIHPELAGTAFETTPLKVGNTLFLCTPRSQVIALDATTGKKLWEFDPKLVALNPKLSHYVTCRGLSYDDASDRGWDVTEGPLPDAKLARALILKSRAEVTTKAAGVSHNIATGQAQPNDPNPVVSPQEFAQQSIRPDCLRRIFLTTRDARLIALSAETGVICPGFGGADGTVNLWQGMPNISPTAYYTTSPVLIAGDVVVVGGAVGDNLSTQLPSGVVRAFDLKTGNLVWNFDPGKPDATEPLPLGETYTQNVPNSWAPASYDADLDLVYLPMGNASPDQYGVGRSKEVERFASSVTALNAKTGKVAWVFQTVHHDLWDYDVPAQPVLIDLTIKNTLVPALIQPTKQGDVFVLDRRTGKPVFPVKEVQVSQVAVDGETPSPSQPVSAISFAPPKATGAQMWGITPIDQMMCRIAFQKMTYAGRYTPPTENGSLTYPGSYGVLNWGGVAVDPERQMLFAMPVYLGFSAQLIKRPGTFDPIVSAPQYGLGNENFGAPYASVVKPFMSALGLPCQQPPWGYVQGVDLTNGKTRYRHVNGTVRDLAPVPVPFKLGVPGIGGPIMTKGGVAFLAAAADNYLRAYNSETGDVLWRARLPAGGQSTPISYQGADGRQYVVQVAGGHGYVGTKLGDSVIAYALP
ncbi:membrane-bound PQQ-dependent dehydrogenase, glucose/quinate/shikimate family [Parasphingorhabdus sp. JC815]|uniref:membrane-bound PQQ-dependent dehydrogenase, glucose/quinate/shikimate family n=1 Tax=Parasphingorhabdus sp. JC815 TaxID=3232140 RepID=UPI0034590ABE